MAMALFQRIFPARRANHASQTDHIREKFFAFNPEHVRLLLFRECDFRGRKLLFDSNAVEQIPIEKTEPCDNYVEVSEGFGYLYTKPNADFSQLTEMVFGSAAMSFRGTYSKIHNLSSPTRLMFTQVFPSPPNSRRKRVSVCSRQSMISRNSSRSLEQSMKLDDSGASSTTSTYEHLSDKSAASDTVLVNRRLYSSPLEVPHSIPTNMASNQNLTVDSGCNDQSFSSISTGSVSFPSIEAVIQCGPTLSCTLFKRLLRRSSRSLDHSGSSLTESPSTEDYQRPSHRQSKLGLAIIMEIPQEKQENILKFFMEHIVLLESMIWRARKTVEVAYHKPNNFVSMMVEVSRISARWLVDILSGPRIIPNLWQNLSCQVCDNRISISAGSDKVKLKRIQSTSVLMDSEKDKSGLLNSFAGFSLVNLEKPVFPFLSISRLLKSENSDRDSRVTLQNSDLVESFLKEFCEILDAVDIKDTNFFMSTLLTAVLTHHLGWVATCFPSSQKEKDLLNGLKAPYNSLWGQLCDIYGAIGHPVKTAQTVVTGTNKNDFIIKILNALTYFIRYTNIERQVVERGDIHEENKTAEQICLQTASIPKENFKTYQDHLNTIMRTEQKAVKLFPKKYCNIPKSFPPSDIKLVSNSVQGKLTNEPLIEEDEDISYTCESKCSTHVENKPPRKTSLLEADNLRIVESVTSEITSEQKHTPQVIMSRINMAGYNSTVSSPFGVDEEGMGNLKIENADKNRLHKTTSKDNLNKSISTDLQGTNSSLVRPSDFPINAGLKKSVSTAKFGSLCSFYEDTENVKCEIKSTDSYSNKYSVIKMAPQKGDFEGGDCDNHFTIPVPEETLQLNENSNGIGCDKPKNSNVVFVLGDDEKLVDLKKECFKDNLRNVEECSTSKNAPKRPTTLAFTKSSYSFDLKEEKDGDFKYDPFTTSLESLPDDLPAKNETSETKFVRSQSEPPEDRSKSEHTKTRYRYSGKKFNLQQYPEVIKNYMKSKNLEFNSLPLDEKSLKLGEISSVPTSVNIDFVDCESDSEEVEVLQTPSNASELEFTSDSFPATSYKNDAAKTQDNQKLETNEAKECLLQKMKIVNVPMPASITFSEPDLPVPYTSSVMKGVLEDYLPDMALQGTANPKSNWESRVKSNLSLAAQHDALDQSVEEAVAIVANLDTWEVQVMSSHTYVTDKGSSGIPIGMSQLVANMLESLLHMWRSHIPPQYCIMHIEQRLQELCVRSKALAQLLLATEFCSMEALTSTLHLEVNDVPLLMAVASTHTPQVTQKYGISFQ